MCDRVIHRRSFKEIGLNRLENSLKFNTTIDVFKVVHVSSHNGLPTIWYETLDNPIYRKQVTLHLIFDNDQIPDNSTHVGSTVYGNHMVHIYQVLSK